MDYSLPELYGKRKKKPAKCPNPLFLEWLTEWRDEAAGKGIKTQYGLNKAMQTLKKYPAFLQSGKECKMLEGFGDKICAMLEEKRIKHIEEYGTMDPMLDSLPEANLCKRKKKSPKTRKPTASPACPPKSVCLGWESGSDECSAVAMEIAPVAARHPSGGNARKVREYIPQYRSGAYGILLTLHRNQQNPGNVGFMAKKSLMKEAQPLADKSFFLPDPGCRYTAWSSMGTLINKGLITKYSSPAKYSLTDTGRQLAIRLLGAHPDGGGADVISDRLNFVIDDGPNHIPLRNHAFVEQPSSIDIDSDEDLIPDLPTLQPSLKKSKAAALKKIHEISDDSEDELPSLGQRLLHKNVISPLQQPSYAGKQDAFPDDVKSIIPLPNLTDGFSHNKLPVKYPTHISPVPAHEVLIPDDDSSNELPSLSERLFCEKNKPLVELPSLSVCHNSPSEDGSHSNELPNLTARTGGMRFVYVDDNNKELLEKDKAVVTIDEEISIGFLIKCKYVDLLLGSKRYKIDNAKSAEEDYVYAYLHNDDAEDLASGLQSPVKQNICSTSTTTSKPPNSRVLSSAMGATTATTASKQPNSRVLSSAMGATTATTASKQPNSKVLSSAMGATTATTASKQPNSKVLSIAMGATTTTGKNEGYSGINPLSNFSTSKVTYPKKFQSHSSRFDVDSQSSESSAIPSLSGDSQSQDSQASTGSTARDDLPTDFMLMPGSFEIVLCVDNCEVYGGGGKESKEILLREIQRNGVLHTVRKLHIGDFVWIAREKLGERELVLDFIVERKRMDDLCSSIVDKRFPEQKFRLRNCGLSRPIYLVEDYGSTLHFSIPEATLLQAVTNTQIVDGFHVKRTTDTKGSAAYLTVMTRYLQSLYNHKTLYACSLPKEGGIHATIDIDAREAKLLNFRSFNEASVKSRALSVREMFCKQLIQLTGLTPEKALALTEKYPTPHRLMEVYDKCVLEKEKENLLKDIKCGPTQRGIGANLSKMVYLLYCPDRNGPAS